MEKKRWSDYHAFVFFLCFFYSPLLSCKEGEKKNVFINWSDLLNRFIHSGPVSSSWFYFSLCVRNDNQVTHSVSPLHIVPPAFILIWRHSFQTRFNCFCCDFARQKRKIWISFRGEYDTHNWIHQVRDEVRVWKGLQWYYQKDSNCEPKRYEWVLKLETFTFFLYAAEVGNIHTVITPKSWLMEVFTCRG